VNTVNYSLPKLSAETSVRRWLHTVYYQFEVAVSGDSFIIKPGSLKLLNKIEPERDYFIRQIKMIRANNPLPCGIEAVLEIKYKEGEKVYRIPQYIQDNYNEKVCYPLLPNKIHDKDSAYGCQEDAATIFGYRHVISKLSQELTTHTTAWKTNSISNEPEYTNHKSKISYYKKHSGIAFNRDSYIPFQMRNYGPYIRRIYNSRQEAYDLNIYKYENDDNYVVMNIATLGVLSDKLKNESNMFHVVDLQGSCFKIEIPADTSSQDKQKLATHLKETKNHQVISNIVSIECEVECYSLTSNPNFFDYHFPIKVSSMKD
jgi:hypothetical protein